MLWANCEFNTSPRLQMKTSSPQSHECMECKERRGTQKSNFDTLGMHILEEENKVRLK